MSTCPSTPDQEGVTSHAVQFSVGRKQSKKADVVVVVRLRNSCLTVSAPNEVTAPFHRCFHAERLFVPHRPFAVAVELFEGGFRMEDFPLVDLSVGSSAVSLLRSACTNHGFFYLKGHGVAQELMDNVLAQSKAFFELPLEQKRMCMANKHNRGYNRFGEECLDPKNQTQGDTKEGETSRVGKHSPGNLR